VEEIGRSQAKTYREIFLAILYALAGGTRDKGRRGCGLFHFPFLWNKLAFKA